ncbi:MAG: NADH:ubiquinone oxidoreductase subunit NDUFA12 [Micavibrio sp.]|nr:NADH:ubiquinone oxidoreductase subunit NDUFA12 [Micavibrio sp.]
MGLLSFLGSLSPAHINMFTMLSSKEQVGTDAYGNKYYRMKKPRPGYKRERRWVMYKGAPEASSVPPEWHGWLHYQSNIVPQQDGEESFRRAWQKPHKSNLTGTSGAYRPPGHMLVEGDREKTTGDYEAWKPQN